MGERVLATYYYKLGDNDTVHGRKYDGRHTT